MGRSGRNKTPGESHSDPDAHQSRNSGGPLLDNNGTLIGINSFRSQGDGLNYAVALDEIKRFLNSQQNRIATAPAKASQPDCSEHYRISITAQAQSDIYGCYARQKLPPPDFWLVYINDKNLPFYGAMDSRRSGRIDTVIISAGDNRGDYWYMDQNCDGYVDLVGFQYPKSDQIDSYQVPSKPIRIDELAQELDRGLRLGRIPYRQLSVCK
jgi:hypothetical protein